jgi:KDO2-lipid IV(A) lauroyltransferase
MDALATRDLREGAAWTRAQAIKNAVVYAAATAAIAVASRMPAGALRALGRALGAFAHAILAKERRIARENIARAFPDWTESDRAELARRAYRELGAWLGETVGELAESSRQSRQTPLEIDDESLRVLARAQARGRGVVFASAHLGPWERVAASLVAAGVPLTTIARESYDPRFTRMYDRLRGARGVRSIYRGTPGAAGKIVRVLAAGGVLGVPMDLRSRVPSIDAPFLGGVAKTAVGPARIALRTGAAVVVGTAAKDERGELCVRITAVDTNGLTAGSSDERVLTERINAELTARICALPEGWPWMHARFG